ncbi:unnamed protein product [Penicillium salamii]|nr:unnamed protein product [Penicillium salamii]
MSYVLCTEYLKRRQNNITRGLPPPLWRSALSPFFLVSVHLRSLLPPLLLRYLFFLRNLDIIIHNGLQGTSCPPPSSCR